MRFNVKREDLLKPLQTLSGVVEKRQTMQILSNALINVQKQICTLTATDGETEIVVKINVEGDSDGLTTVPLKKLLDSCRSLNDGVTLGVEIKKDKAEVKCGKTRFMLMTMPSNEFPVMDGAGSKAQLEIQEKELKSIIEKVQFAMAIQDVRYFLNGMYIELEGKEFRAVATDGHRLALAKTEVENDEGKKFGIIVPRKAVMELAKLLENKNDLVKITVGENYLRLETENVKFTTKLIDGTYPAYQTVIPTATSKVMVAEKNELKDCLMRTSVLSSEKYRGIKIELKENKLKAIANNPEHEEAEDEVEVEYSGEPVEAGFNVAYLMDAVSGVESEKVKVLFSDVNNSALIKEQNGERTLYVVMPMRL